MTLHNNKGGRTARAPEARMTPDDLATLLEMLTALDLNFADWLHERVADWQRPTLRRGNPNFKTSKAKEQS